MSEMNNNKESFEESIKSFESKKGAFKIYWQEAREYSFLILDLISNACENEQEYNNLEGNMNVFNEQYKDNPYLKGILYEYDILSNILKLEQGEEHRLKVAGLLNKIRILLEEDETAIIPPIEIFYQLNMKTTQDTNNKGENMSKENQNINNILEENINNEGEEMKTNTVKKSKKGKIFKYGLIGAALTAICVGGYFGYKYLIDKE